MTLLSILKIYNSGIDFEKVKLVRHQDNRQDFPELIKKDLLEEYQSYQSKPVFHECTHIISFVKDEGTRALFYGVYKINSYSEAPIANKVSQSFFDTWLATPGLKYEDFSYDNYKYDLVKVDAFDELKMRLIVDWGKAAISWHQWAANDKEVIAINPSGYVKDFPGYLDFILDYTELKTIIDNPIENKVWQQMLSSVYGIYLIQDSKTGLQYVGSAYNESGILGRWSNYASSGHGGNKLLKELLEQNGSEYKLNFKYTILRTLPKTYTAEEVINVENLYKSKLGSKVFGLNSN